MSRQIYGIYLKYIAPEDIVVYSIDEVFIDATSYLSHYMRCWVSRRSSAKVSPLELPADDDIHLLEEVKAQEVREFYTGYKKLMQAHKYFACGTLVCMGMAIYSGHKIAPKKKKAEKTQIGRAHV